MAKKSMADCVYDLDFEEAYSRWKDTSARWKSEWYAVCETIYSKAKEWSQKYILDPISRTIKKIASIKEIFAAKVKNTNILIADDCPEWNNSSGVEKCYLIEFFNEKFESIASKVGTTVRTVQTRIREELKSKTYQNMGAKYCVIHRVYDCGDIPAEGVESLFRAEYIKRYPASFCKNDRFIKEHFDYAEADKIFKNYIEKA